jgi:hypothetical protein
MKDVELKYIPNLETFPKITNFSGSVFIYHFSGEGVQLAGRVECLISPLQQTRNQREEAESMKEGFEEG